MNRFRIPLGIFAAWVGLFLCPGHAAPVIQQAPLGAEVPEGEVLALRVVAIGSGLRYQWLRDGQAIPDANAPLFLRVRAAQENAGAYSVRIEDDAGGLVETSAVKVSVSKGTERSSGGVWDPYQDVPYPDAVRQGVVSVSAVSGVTWTIPGTTYGGPAYDRIAVLQDGRVYRWGRFQFRAPVGGTFGPYTNYTQDTSKFVPIAVTSNRVIDAVENGGVLVDSGALIQETQQSFEPPIEGKRLVALAGPAHPPFSFSTNVALRNDGSIFLYTGYTSYPDAPAFPDLKAFIPPWSNDHAAIGVGIDDIGISAIREDGFMFYQPFFSTNGSPQLMAPPSGTRLVSGTPSRAVTLDHRLVQWDGSKWVAAAPEWVQGSVLRNFRDLLILKPGPPVVSRPPAGASVTYGQEISLEVDGGGVGALYSWYRGTALVGEASRNPRLVIASAKPTDAGEYRVVVSNDFGSVTSSPPAVVLVGSASAANEVEALGSASIPLSMRQTIVQVSGADTHLLTLDTSGSVKGKYLPGYSYSNYGEGDVPASATSDVVEIEAWMFRSSALKKDGSVVRWGARWVPDPSRPDGVALQTSPVQTKSGRIRSIRGGGTSVAIGLHGEVLFWNEALADYSANGVPESLRSGVVEINRLFALKEDGTVVSFSGAPVPAEAASGMAHLVESAGEGPPAGAGVLNAAAGIKRDGRLIAWKGGVARYLPTRISDVVRLVSIDSSAMFAFRKDLIAIGRDGRAESVWDDGIGSVVLPSEWQGRIQDLLPNASLSGLGVVALLKPAPGWVRVSTTYDGNLSFALNSLSLRGLPLSTVLVDGPASLINGAVVFSKPGTATVRVSEVNLLTPEDVTSYTTTLAVTRKEQQLTVAALDSLKVGDPALPIVAQSSSGLPVTFSQQESGLLLVNGTVRAARAGVFHLVVDQRGDSQFLPAPTVVQTIQVVPGISLKRSGAGAAAGVVLQIWAGDGQAADVQQSTNQVDWTLVAAVKGLGPDKPVTVSLPDEAPGQTARYWRVVVTKW